MIVDTSTTYDLVEVFFCKGKSCTKPVIIIVSKFVIPGAKECQNYI